MSMKFHRALRFSPFKWVLAGMLGFVSGAFGIELPTNTSEERVFKLREASAFDHSEFVNGQRSQTQDNPFSEVKSYPAFKTSKPIYGSIQFAEGTEGLKTGRKFYFAIDESGGTGKGYDCLYLDMNRDFNLTNDAVVRPMAHPPANAGVRYSVKQQVFFDYINVDFDYGSADTRSVQIMPRLVTSAQGAEEYKVVSFVRTRVFMGDIKLGSKKYEAVLGSRHMVVGRLDVPYATLQLSLNGGRADWWGGDSLGALHKVDGRFYTLKTTPMGDELRVAPYKGDLGIFELGKGGRKLDKLAARGSLGATNQAVEIGDHNGGKADSKVASCSLPVGDYLPRYLAVEFGNLEINISDNYHSDGKPRSRGGAPKVYGITIRNDKPFVLDFSNKPEVLFASPAKDQRVLLGSTLEVSAVLVDPKLDIMIRGLDDTTRQQTTNSEGRALGYKQNVSLDPIVTITRVNGEKVATGVMPFG